MTTILRLKGNRSAVAAKLAEWEDEYMREHGTEPTEAHKRRDPKHRELRRLLADLNKHIGGIEGTAPADDSLSAPADERRAERGRIKAKMRRWDRDFEALRGRQPTEADREADETFGELQQRLQALSTASGSSLGGGGGGSSQAIAAHDPPPAAAGTSTGPSASPVVIAGGATYNERVLANLHSKGVLDGFRGTQPAELEAATAMFAHYDTDRDGVIGFEEFYFIMSSLAQRVGKPLDAQRAERLFSLADIDGNRVLDLNEWLWLRRSLAERSATEASLESQHMAARSRTPAAAATSTLSDPSGFGALGLG
jgi:hypothetical protein